MSFSSFCLLIASVYFSQTLSDTGLFIVACMWSAFALIGIFFLRDTRA